MSRPRVYPCCLALLAPLVTGACSTEAPSVAAEVVTMGAPAPVTMGGDPPVQPAGDFRPHTEPLSRLRFPVPATGVTVDDRHYDPTLPAKKFRHSIRLATSRGTVVLVDVWDNPSRLGLRPWFDAHLAFLVGEGTRVTEQPMSRARTPGILLHQPRSPQALSQAIAVLAAGDQVVRVTCIDFDGDEAARRLFERVVDEIEVGVTP